MLEIGDGLYSGEAVVALLGLQWVTDLWVYVSVDIIVYGRNE